MDLLILSRAQFALTIMFHYLFPPLTIGLGGLIVALEGLYLKTGDKAYEEAAKFWTKIFAINFVMGVATGIVMEFQFGTNWSAYSRFVGDVFGSALAAEGIFAFFLESGFLAVLVFGWDKVSPRVHFFAACMVALGAIFSSIWIVVANSWQQTPAGYHIVQYGNLTRAEITDFWAVVFCPSSMHRLAHVLIGSYILAAFFVMSLSAWYLVKGRHIKFAKHSFGSALALGTVMSIAALIQGDLQGKKVAHTQPTKLAAMEAVFHTETNGTPLYVFGFPDEKTQQICYGLGIPKLLSFLSYGTTEKPVLGLDKYPKADWPNVPLTFHSFHVMVGIGMICIFLTLLASWYRWRGTLYQQRWLLWIFVPMVLLPYTANQLGWVTAEVGRQPWTVYGLLRTSDSLSKSVVADQVLGSIIMFSLLFAALLIVWLYLLNHKIQQGPEGAVLPPTLLPGENIVASSGISMIEQISKKKQK
jgi:cytochrome d ubiquinol oxidase subunit I